MMDVRLFLLQRGTAFLLLPLVLVHLCLIVFAVQNGLTGDEILSRTRGSFFWAVFYGLFVLSAAFHGAIGIYAILGEWTGMDVVSLRMLSVFYVAVQLGLGFSAVYAVTVP